jgi:hypothetical protein
MIWRPVVGHENFYEVSDTGEVRVKSRTITTGVATFTAKPKLLVKTVGGRANNYHRVMLMNPKRHAYVHHIVLETFRGERPVDMVGCHKDDDGFNNNLDNLYWGTSEQNQADKARNRAAAVESDAETVPF